MMTEQLEMSILAAPLAAIDRRVLSQAWYAALRFGREEPRGSSTVSRAPLRETSCVPPRDAWPARRPVAVRAGFASAARSRAIGPRVPEQIECARSRAVRSPRPELAGAIEKAFGDAALRRATFSVGRGSARIVVVLQTRGNRTTLIALCRPHLCAAVARALARARVALAARGIGVELRPHGVAACS
jgi:hypothetical protein